MPYGYETSIGFNRFAKNCRSAFDTSPKEFEQKYTRGYVFYTRMSGT